jgi:hypothetical protein
VVAIRKLPREEAQRVFLGPGQYDAAEMPLCGEAFGDLLAAVGNHEAKALLLAAMKEGVVYSASNLHRLMLERQGRFMAWRLSGRVPFDYCVHSLAPIGLVATEVLNEDLSVYGFSKTRYGRQLGDALVGHMLSFSERYPAVSLIDLFGRTNTSAASTRDVTGGERWEHPKRSPWKNYQIFSQLLRQELPVREIDLAVRLGEPLSTLGPRLRILAQKQLIIDDSKPIDEYVAFRQASQRTLDLPPPNSPAPTLSMQICAIFHDSSNAALTRELLYTELVRRHPELRGLNQESTRRRISGVASHLERYGYLERVKFSTDVQSMILLTETQRRMLTDLVTLLDRFAELDQAFLHNGRRLASGVANNPARFRALLLKAKRTSPDINRARSDATGALLVTLVDKYPGSTTTELRDHLAQEYDHGLTKGRVKQVLRDLRTRGKIMISRQAGAFRYRLGARVSPVAPATTSSRHGEGR